MTVNANSDSSAPSSARTFGVSEAGGDGHGQGQEAPTSSGPSTTTTTNSKAKRTSTGPPVLPKPNAGVVLSSASSAPSANVHQDKRYPNEDFANSRADGTTSESLPSSKKMMVSSIPAQDYLSWDEYFMYTAMLSAGRAKDPSTQVGACIVNEDNRIIGIGYNGFPRISPPPFSQFCRELVSCLLVKVQDKLDARRTKNSAADQAAKVEEERKKIIEKSALKKNVEQSAGTRESSSPSEVDKDLACTPVDDEVDGGRKDENDDQKPLRDPYSRMLFACYCCLEAGAGAFSFTVDADATASTPGDLQRVWSRYWGVNDAAFPWAREAAKASDTKYPYVMHAEANAILNKTVPIIPDRSSDRTLVKTNQQNQQDEIKPTTRIYTSLFPCNECAKLVIQAGIREVVYLSDKHGATDSAKAAKKLFQLAGVRCREFIPEFLRDKTHNSKWFFRGGSPLVAEGGGAGAGKCVSLEEQERERRERGIAACDPLEECKKAIDRWKTVCPITGRGIAMTERARTSGGRVGSIGKDEMKVDYPTEIDEQDRSILMPWWRHSTALLFLTGLSLGALLAVSSDNRQHRTQYLQ
ncbi:unnamed protein product [Amoebophrya sp. A120]|nr:unnamed protein product [Amoebophrya sp. A120]|eukprot:GSA120T00003777001.1